MKKNIKTNSPTKVVLLLYAFTMFFVGIFMILFVNELSLITTKGVSSEVTKITQQFLGSAYILIGGLMYSIRNLKDKPMLITIIFLNIMGCINLFLLFKFHNLIILPIIYFSLQIIMQAIAFLALIEQVRNQK